MVQAESGAQAGSGGRTLRVAIIGSGPTGFYVAAPLLKQDDLDVSIDMFDRLPTPFGLVRGGVAPDHLKTKSVVKAYDKTARDPRFRFYGNVELGQDIDVAGLRRHYHAIFYCTGAQTDRRMRIPGEQLGGSHTATEFVAWYNGHPDFRDLEFDLSTTDVVVVGVGNVAVDVARILCRTDEELLETDIAEHARDVLRDSKVERVHMLGRRGVAQAAFTNTEIKELGEMADAAPVVREAEVALDELSEAAIADDRVATKKVEIVQSYVGFERGGKSRSIELRFLVSPTELIDDGTGRVGKVRIVHNELVAGDGGRLSPRATDREEEIACGLVFRSVGYRGVRLPGVPFRDDWSTIPHQSGRVIDPEAGDAVVPGEYVAGWIKRGPQGVIGTNKPDALESVEAMLEDLQAGRVLTPEAVDPGAADAWVRGAQARVFTYEDWTRLDALELERGAASGRPRVKFTRVDEMWDAIRS